MISTQDARRRQSRLLRRRLRLAAAAAGVAAVDLTAKAWAQKELSATGVELGPVDLRLGYNPGVAFSLGAEAPSWLVIAVTAAITAAVAVFAWRAARQGGRALLAALALILGGAVANLADRAADGVVTDYLHTGWWPTFNLADTAIVTGALLFALTAWRSEAAEKRLTHAQATDASLPAQESSPRTSTAPSTTPPSAPDIDGRTVARGGHAG